MLLYVLCFFKCCAYLCFSKSVRKGISHHATHERETYPTWISQNQKQLSKYSNCLPEAWCIDTYTVNRFAIDFEQVWNALIK